MTARLSVKYAKNTTPDERRTMHAMSFRSRGSLQDWLHYAVDAKTEDKVIIARENGVMVGWGMRRENGEVGFWTRTSHRRQGIGTRMVRKAANIDRSKKIVTYPHDAKSHGLFIKAGVR